jgi:hypothetical protein
MEKWGLGNHRWTNRTPVALDTSTAENTVGAVAGQIRKARDLISVANGLAQRYSSWTQPAGRPCAPKPVTSRSPIFKSCAV